jgi:single-stranded DNA-binding protein
VTLLGNLVAKPDIRYKANPVVAITEVVLATTSKWLDKASNKYKEWTSYHHVKVEGELVEQALLHADKGDIILIHGYLNNIKPTADQLKSLSGEHPSIVHASFIQKFAKGYTQSINQINCSAILTSTPHLMLTEQNKHFAQANIIIKQPIYNVEKQNWQTVPVERAIHIWGKQAQYLAENGTINDELVIEGKLNYASDSTKAQFIDAKKLYLFKV